MRPLAPYLRNCFWLVVPVLLFNLLFAGALPPAYQRGLFWLDIPLGIALPENVLRALVLGLPILMPLAGPGAPARTLGLALYLSGLAIYAAAWLLLMLLPASAWSTSAVGFTAPAWTPLFWLGGIGWLSDGQLFLPLRWYRRWMFVLLCALFLLFHNLHAALVFSRLG